jgi:hypothetical protein
MRKFHRLLRYDPEDKLTRVVEHSLANFDPTLLWEGARLVEAIPPSARLLVGPGEPSDYMANPLSWLICSQRFVDILIARAGQDLQVVDAPLYDAKSAQAVKGYKIVNVVRTVACLDLERSDVSYDKSVPGKIVAVWRIAVLAHKVPSDAHVFRMTEWPYEVIFSGEMANDCVGKGLRGLAFQECATRDSSGT